MTARRQDAPAPRTGNRQLMREVNRNLILQVVRDHQPISQADILRRTRLSAGTVANIVSALRRDGLVSESGAGPSTGGRRPVLLRLEPDARCAIGVQLSAEETLVTVVDLAGRVLASAAHPTDPNAGPEQAMQRVAEHVLALVRQARVARRKLLGVGLGVDGLVDGQAGVLKTSAHFDWRGAPLRDLLAEATRLDCLLVGVGHAMAFGEYSYGAGREARAVLCVNVDAGIGCAAVTGGRIARGAHHMAGEIGHSPALANGPVCRCGRRGCLETVASGGAIAAEARRRLAAGQRSALEPADVSGPSRQAVRAVFDAARDGDRLARAIVRRAVGHLATAVVGLVNFADPEMVLLTGYVTHAGGGLVCDLVAEQVAGRILNPEARSVVVREGALGGEAATIGGAALLFERAFRVPVES